MTRSNAIYWYESGLGPILKDVTGAPIRLSAEVQNGRKEANRSRKTNLALHKLSAEGKTFSPLGSRHIIPSCANSIGSHYLVAWLSIFIEYEFQLKHSTQLQQA